MWISPKLHPPNSPQQRLHTIGKRDFTKIVYLVIEQIIVIINGTGNDQYPELLYSLSKCHSLTKISQYIETGKCNLHGEKKAIETASERD